MLTKKELEETYEKLSDENKRRLSDYILMLLNKELRDGK